MKKKDVKLYNVMFPIWLIPYVLSFELVIDLFYGTFVIVFNALIILLGILLANFAVDSIVYLIALKALKVENIWKNYSKGIWKVYLFGFLSDIIATIPLIIMLFAQGFIESKIINNFMNAVLLNPYRNILALLFVLICLFIGGFLIYIFNSKISFKKLEIDDKKKKTIALVLAIVTAPYLFLIPTML